VSDNEPTTEKYPSIRIRINQLWRISKQRWYFSVPVAILVLYFLYSIFFVTKEEYAIAEVKKGTLKIEVVESGAIRAVKSVSIVAPKAQTSLQIINMVPEGTTVKVGDMLIQFDPTELQKKIDDKEAELEIAQASLQKFQSEMISNRSKAKGDSESADAQYKQARLQLQQMEFEADVKKQEEQLAMRQAEIAFQQAKERILAQAVSDSADERSLKLKVKQAQSDLEKARADLAELSIVAKQPGLVVYQEIWKGSTMSKVQVGDQPWRGQSILEIPDLSELEVKIEVNEIDVAKIQKGQPAKVILDAFPDPPFHGHVKDVAVLAKRKDSDPDIKVFDVVVAVDSVSNLMKPGMSSTVTILADELKDVLYVPIDAVEMDSSSFVWVVGRTSATRTKVALGKRNDDFVEIKSGVEPGEKVRLLSQKAKADEQSKPDNSAAKQITKRVR